MSAETLRLRIDAALINRPSLDAQADWNVVVERYGVEHPAAIGCLSDLVRKAWGPSVTIDHMDGPRNAATIISGERGVVLFTCRSLPLVGRLARPLEYAPR